MLYLSLKALHLIAMAGWFGAALFVPGDLRRSLGSPGCDLELLRDRVGRANRFAAIFGWTTFLTGLALLFERGGFGAVPVPIHVGLTLTLVAIGVGALGLGGTWRRIDAQLKEGASRESVAPLVKRTAMFSGIFQLLWLVILLLMVFRHHLI